MKKNGFTLIELLVVIALLIVLVLFAVPNVIKVYNENVIKNMHIQEANVVDAANLFVDDYCDNPIDDSVSCPSSYTNGLNGKKVVCLNDIQNKIDKYLGSVKYKGSDCKGYVTYYLNSETGVYTDEKAFLFCGKKSSVSYKYQTTDDYSLDEYCICFDDEVCNNN